MNEKYDEMLATLKNLRQREGELREEKKAMIEAVTSTQSYKSAELELTSVSAAIVEFEKQIKDMAVADYTSNGIKQPHPKVQVKLFQKFTVLDPARVLTWVKTSLADALVYDEKKVKDYATKIGPVDGTEIVEEVRALIAKEL